MTNTPDAVDARRDRRAARRLLHRPRSVWVSIALLVAIAGAVLLLVELILQTIGAGPALLDLDAARTAVTEGGPWAIAVIGGAAALGILCLWGAVGPGSTHRRILGTERAPIVVDDAILAGALSRTAARVAGVPAGQVTTHVTRRRAVITVTPTTGFDVDAAQIARAGDALLGELGIGPALRTSIFVDTKGKLS